MRRNRTIRMLATGLAVAGLAAGCGGGDDGDSGDAAAAATVEETDATDAVEPEGNPATGEPIPIGFINNEGGAFSVPELRVGNEVAEDHINEQLGGVNGRPIH